MISSATMNILFCFHFILERRCGRWCYLICGLCNMLVFIAVVGLFWLLALIWSQPRHPLHWPIRELGIERRGVNGDSGGDGGSLTWVCHPLSHNIPSVSITPKFLLPFSQPFTSQLVLWSLWKFGPQPPFFSLFFCFPFELCLLPFCVPFAKTLWWIHSY